VKIIIADTSSLILLTKIGRLNLLEYLFGEVLVTNEVAKEYGMELPSFISVKDPENIKNQRELLRILDEGEASSIALAIEIPGCRIKIDEKKGRRVALELDLEIMGTLGVLIEASDKGFLRLDQRLIDRLNNAGFYLSASLKNSLLDRS